MTESRLLDGERLVESFRDSPGEISSNHSIYYLRRSLFHDDAVIKLNSPQKERLMNTGARNLTFIILAAFPFLLIAVFEKIDHVMKGGLGGF